MQTTESTPAILHRMAFITDYYIQNYICNIYIQISLQNYYKHIAYRITGKARESSIGHLHPGAMQPKGLFAQKFHFYCLLSIHGNYQGQNIESKIDVLGKPNASTTTFNLPTRDPQLMLLTSIFKVLSGCIYLVKPSAYMEFQLQGNLRNVIPRCPSSIIQKGMTKLGQGRLIQPTRSTRSSRHTEDRTHVCSALCFPFAHRQLLSDCV